MKCYINPEMAAQLLTDNSSNRRINRNHVISLSKEMKAGQWRYNGQAVVVGIDGTLIDGQHRLTACVESDTSFLTELIRGVESDAFDTIDIGKIRSAGDTLTTVSFKNANNLAALSKLYYLYKEKDDKRDYTFNRPKVNNRQILETATELNEDFVEARI